MPKPKKEIMRALHRKRKEAGFVRVSFWIPKEAEKIVKQGVMAVVSALARETGQAAPKGYTTMNETQLLGIFVAARRQGNVRVMDSEMPLRSCWHCGAIIRAGKVCETCNAMAPNDR